MRMFVLFYEGWHEHLKAMSYIYSGSKLATKLLKEVLKCCHGAINTFLKIKVKLLILKYFWMFGSNDDDDE